MEEGFGYGAGNDQKTGRSKKSKPAAAAKSQTSKNTIRLTPSDPHYPKDVPSGAKFYEKFWPEEELLEVVNQGCLHTCWTIASTSTLTSRLLIEKKIATLKRMSFLHMVVGLFEKIKSNGELKDLNSLKKFLEDEGAILEEDCKCADPIGEMRKKKISDKSKIPKPVLCTHKSKPKEVFKVKELTLITKVDEKELICMLNKGPVAISIENHQDFAKIKGDVIYRGPKDGKRVAGYHMVMCSGYGTDNDGVHYWKVQNSGGTRWGKDGFGKIIRQTSNNENPSLIKSILCPVLLDNYVAED